MWWFWIALVGVVLLSACGSNEAAVHLFVPKQLAGAIVSLQGAPVAKVDGNGVAFFWVSHGKHLLVVTKAGFAPIEVAVDTSDGSGEIYPSIEELQVKQN